MYAKFNVIRLLDGGRKALVAFVSSSQAQTQAKGSENGPGLQSTDPTLPLVKEILILLFVLQGSCPHRDSQIWCK